MLLLTNFFLRFTAENGPAITAVEFVPEQQGYVLCTIMKAKGVKGKYVHGMETMAHLSNAVDLLWYSLPPFNSSPFME